jgi:hypothetical protein
MGDGVLVELARAINPIEYAVELQRAKSWLKVRGMLSLLRDLGQRFKAA